MNSRQSMLYKSSIEEVRRQMMVREGFFEKDYWECNTQRHERSIL